MSWRLRLIHGARSVLGRAKGRAQPDAFETWARGTEQRRGHHVAAVAVANKLARIVWAVWAPPRPFTAERRQASPRIALIVPSHPEHCTELD